MLETSNSHIEINRENKIEPRDSSFIDKTRVETPITTPYSSRGNISPRDKFLSITKSRNLSSLHSALIYNPFSDINK